MLRSAGKLIVHTLSETIDNKVLKLSAALAYYTIFSIPGLLIVIIWISGIFYGEKAVVEGTVYAQLAEFIGKDTAYEIQEALRSAVFANDSGWATTLGVITLIFGATGVFGEMQDSINHVWHLKTKPKKGRGLLKIIINRLLSFSMVIVMAFLMLVSLVLHGVMEVFLNRISGGTMEAVMVYIINLLVSFFITVLLFAAIFKVLPDARIKWRHIMAGSITTAVLFMIGKYLITYYLAHSTITSTYGAAGSFIIVVLWVYYSAVILYLGAIYTRVYAIHKGSHIYPNKYAVWVEQKEIESKQPLDRKSWADEPKVKA